MKRHNESCKTVTHVIKPKNLWHFLAFSAGNTALCTVGKSGNDLHYRGYDILDLAKHCEFEEVAHLLIQANCRPVTNSPLTKRTETP